MSRQNNKSVKVESGALGGVPSVEEIPLFTSTPKTQKNTAMTIATARLLFEAGSIYRAVITHKILNNNWIVVLERNGKENSVLQKERGGEREFKTIDAAFRAIQEIGFKGASIDAR